MKFITFQGGLGNQLFQYAFYKYLKQEYQGDTFKGFYPSVALKRHNGLEITYWFDLSLPKSCWWSHCISYTIWVINKILKRMNLNPILSKDDFSSKKNALLYDGFWQDKKYLTELGIPNFKKDLAINEQSMKYLEMIRECESVAIHVRRGDYTAPEVQHIYGNICTIEYYNKAIKIIKEKVENPRFFFFSDDPAYVNHNFELDSNSIIVSCNTGLQSVLDMYLMSHTKHMILANSTFSCWAAYLNKRTETVICPNRWRNDSESSQMIMDEWIQIP